MQISAVRTFQTTAGQTTLISPWRMVSDYPSAWEQARAWADRETKEEVALVVITLLLVGQLFFSLYQALQNSIVF